MKIGTISKFETHETKIKASNKTVSLFSDKPYTHIVSKFAMSDVLEVLAVYVAEQGDNFFDLKNGKRLATIDLTREESEKLYKGSVDSVCSFFKIPPIAESECVISTTLKLLEKELN